MLTTNEARRRQQRQAERHFHLQCPVCDILAWPLNGLFIDRMRWLIAHLWTEHPFEASYFEIARAAHLREVADGARDGDAA